MNNFVNIFVPILSIATFGFTGSLHCLGMCSPLVATCQKKTWQYFISRTICYTAIGIIAGVIGKFISKNFLLFSAKNLSLFIVTLCIVQIIFIVKTNNKELNSNFYKLFFFINKYSPLSHSVTLGIITSLLPCSFLYSAILMCIGFTNPALSGLGMFVFALVTSPVLLGSKGIMYYLSKKSQNIFKYLSVFLLILLAIIALIRGGFFYKDHNNLNQKIDCH